MKSRLVDWMWAGGTALVLTGIAVFVVFVIHPGGIEDGGNWAMVLLPGASIGLRVPDDVFKTVPLAEPFVFWTITFVLSYVWYLAIAYVLTKSCRFIIRAPSS
jgi:hypothetical protein